MFCRIKRSAVICRPLCYHRRCPVRTRRTRLKNRMIHGVDIDLIIWVNTSKYLGSYCHRVVKEIPNRISGLHPLENGDSPFTDCIGGQILQIKQPQQPTETFYEAKIYSPSPMRNRQKTYFIKLCTLCRLSGRYSPILQRNYNAILRKKQVESFNFCHFFEKISEFRLSKRVTL